MSYIVRFLLVLAVAGIGKSVDAGLITATYRGTVTRSFDTTGVVDVNDTFELTFTYDTTTPISDSNLFATFYAEAITELSLSMGSYAATGLNNRINVANNPLVGDTFQVSAGDGAGTLSGLGLAGKAIESLRVNLTGEFGTALSSEELPETPPDPSDFNLGAGLTVFFEGGNIRSTVESVTIESAAVPEPTTLAIFGLGALGLVGGAIRRRKQQAVD